MPNITSFEILEKEIEKIDGKPTVLEALWDGDTEGWFLVLSLYYTTGYLHWKEEKEVNLGVVTFEGDIRIFNGQVPSWPEAELAKEMGAKAAEKYGLIFYFPSDKEPDHDCPSFTKRHLAIHCADCGKLIIPTSSPYLPKDICYHCHLERKHVDKLKNDLPEDDSVKMFLYKDGIYESAPYLTELIDKIENTDQRQIVVLTVALADIIELRQSFLEQLQASLASYKKSDLSGERRKFGSFESVVFEGKEYELETLFNNEHSEISMLIYRYDATTKAVLEGWDYRLFLKSGITYRDDSFLRFAHYVSKGQTNIKAVIDRHKKALTEDEVLKTLTKLKTASLITMEGNIVAITETGRLIL